MKVREQSSRENINKNKKRGTNMPRLKVNEVELVVKVV